MTEWNNSYGGPIARERRRGEWADQRRRTHQRAPPVFQPGSVGSERQDSVLCPRALWAQCPGLRQLPDGGRRQRRRRRARRNRHTERAGGLVARRGEDRLHVAENRQLGYLNHEQRRHGLAPVNDICRCRYAWVLGEGGDRAGPRARDPAVDGLGAGGDVEARSPAPSAIATGARRVTHERRGNLGARGVCRGNASEAPVSRRWSVVGDRLVSGSPRRRRRHK